MWRNQHEKQTVTDESNCIANVWYNLTEGDKEKKKVAQVTLKTSILTGNCKSKELYVNTIFYLVNCFSQVYGLIILKVIYIYNRGDQISK